MFRELVALGRELEQEGKLPPPGFYDYGDPIRWIVHLLPDRAILVSSEMSAARPFSGRTNRVEAHLLADEASYALGVERQKKGGKDVQAAMKHDLFRGLVSTFLASEELRDLDLRAAIENLDRALDEGWAARHDRFGDIANKDWVSFVPEYGPLENTHLFEHPEAKAFWIEEMQRRCASGEDQPGEMHLRGMCSVCGNDGQRLVRKLPLKVKLADTVPFTSLNRDAFTSFIAPVRGGDPPSKLAHLGICYVCGDTASRAFNFLNDSAQHRRQILRDPRRENRIRLTNQIALFWLKAPGPIRVEEVVVHFNELAFEFGVVAAEAPTAELSQLHALLKLPWHPVDSALRLDDYGFYLAVLSPNIGRIAVREWIATTLAEVKSNLASFLDATTMVSAQGDSVRPTSVGAIVAALASTSPNVTRSLLRTAYLGVKPPTELMIPAGQRLNHLLANERSLRERQQRRGQQAPVWNDGWTHALAAAIKLVLVFGDKEVETMTEVNPLFRSKAYHCGRLLAALEEAQQRYHYTLHHEWLKTTIASRGYGRAASAPSFAFPNLFRLAASAYLPEVGQQLRDEVNAISATIAELGDMPSMLSLAEQSQFGLGFFHQRARMQAEREARKNVREEAVPNEE